MRHQGVSRHVCRHWRTATCVLMGLLFSLVLLPLTSLQFRDHKLTKRSVPDITTASNQSQVRLVNGQTHCEGRVEVLHEGVWGSVCDDDWDMVDAGVVCRQLGCGRAAAVGSSSRYGQGPGPILLDNVDCKGTEMHLGQCGSQGWGVHNCYHYEDVAVICKDKTVTGSQGSSREPTTPSRDNIGLRDGHVRLAGVSDHCRGRVEIYFQGSWGTVCDDDWGMRDASVVCQQLGCGSALGYTTNAYFGYGTGLILLDNVHCNGYERQLATCHSLGWGIHNCGHHEDAGVICAGLSTTSAPTLNTGSMAQTSFDFKSTAATEVTVPVTGVTLTTPTTSLATRDKPTVRLVNGNNSCQGRVEVSHNNIWGTVCDDDWKLENAQVVCRQLGCGPALAALPLAYFGYGTGLILLDNVDCQGNERTLEDCFNLGWGQQNCGHHEDASVICSTFSPWGGTVMTFGMTQKSATAPAPKAPAEGTLRLVGGKYRCEGRVELFHRGAWGTVCDDAWDLRNAQVVCRLLGCGDPIAAHGEAFFGQGVGAVLLDNVKCSGKENSLLQCSHIAWDVHNCDHSEDAGVTCTPL
ncbi:scavenger receptor cysteine-rich domain-containing group B protein [Brachyhypopomus gauderio]|uniref:scavenger receptor cysteine-rich domain-containing group B protein n=1 Tax=Brachyhypopomus gauderio TaxID=698409 RepID=UPI0040427898